MPSNESKKIMIKPELFKMQKTKTVKAGKINAPIDTTKIKEQLTANIMKRRKQKIKQEMEIEKKKEESEFDKSFNFMLEEKEKEREVKEKNLRKSIKHRQASTANPVAVNVEWPTDSGLVPVTWSDKELDGIHPDNLSDSIFKYKVDHEINYGCLKGGLKKTFKNVGGSSGHSHSKTLSNRVQFDPSFVPTPPTAVPVTIAPQAPIYIQTPVAPQTVIIPSVVSPAPVPTPMMPSAPIPVIAPTNIPAVISTNTPAVKTVQVTDLGTNPPEYIPPPINIHTNPAMVPPVINVNNIKSVGGKIVGEKTTEDLANEVKVPSLRERTIQKTIKYKYKLGKNKTLNNRLSVLCTSKRRMKQIQDAKKELQKTPMEKMRKYLMDRNLLSSGSFAPPDVIKKMYEEANITADITNHNDDKLLENYLDKH